MRRASALLLLALLAGCAGHGNVQVNSSGAPAGGGTTVYAQGRSSFGNLLGIGILAGVMYGSESGSEYAARVYEPDATRRIAVQDCTRPIEDWSANLKCR